MKSQTVKLSMGPVNVENATERQKPMLEKAIQKNGRLPNMYANMVNSPGLLGNQIWLLFEVVYYYLFSLIFIPAFAVNPSRGA